MSVTVVNARIGNFGSVLNMLKRLDVEASLTSDPDEVANASRLILPGVGSFDTAMKNMADLGLLEPLTRQAIDNGTPIFGICLGMQLFATYGEEGGVPGLGWVPGRVVRMQPEGPSGPLPVPHIGWSTVQVKKPSRFFTDVADDARYYFVHTYKYVCDDDADVLGTSDYGGEFTCAIERGNLAGVQFHPEKSHQAGMRLLAEFLER